MKKANPVGWMVVLVTVTTTLSAANPPAPPKVSSYAPAKDIIGQVEYYQKRLAAAVSKDELKTNEQKRMAKDAHTLTVLLLAIGMHDEDNPLKASAPKLLPLSQKLAALTKDQAAAKVAFEELSAAIRSKATGGAPLKWEKVASLHDLMEQVPNINNRLRSSLRKRKFEKDQEKSAGYSAALAVIAQASMADLEAVTEPGQEADWYKYCIEMRDSSGEINKAIHAQEYDAATKAMKRLQKSCDDCHEAFRVEED